MGDAELDAIRQRRLAELSGGSASPAGGQGPSQQGGGEQDHAARAAEEDDSRRTLMSQILDAQARERLSRIGLVRPERARSLEELLLRMAKSGQIRNKVSDEQLLSLLDQVAQAESKDGAAGPASKSKITFNRRSDKVVSDDEDFDDDDFGSTRASRGATSTTQSGKPAARPSNNDDDDDDIFDL